MTKLERNELQRMANQLGDITNLADKLFHELQNMSREAGMTVYCSALHNARQLNTDKAWEARSRGWKTTTYKLSTTSNQDVYNRGYDSGREAMGAHSIA